MAFRVSVGSSHEVSPATASLMGAAPGFAASILGPLFVGASAGWSTFGATAMEVGCGASAKAFGAAVGAEVAFGDSAG